MRKKNIREQHTSFLFAFHLRVLNLKLKMLNFCTTVPCQHPPQENSFNTERELEKQSTIHQLIITLRHTVTVRTKDRRTVDEKKKIIMRLFVPR